MSTVERDYLEKQLRVYADAEPWKVAHIEAMHCRDVEAAIRFGVFLLDEIQRHNRQWAADIEQGKVAFSWDQSADFAKVYGWWLDQSQRIRTAIDDCEQAGYTVDGADRFRAACREVELLPLDTERTKRAFEAIDRGEVHPLTRVSDALQTRLD